MEHGKPYNNGKLKLGDYGFDEVDKFKYWANNIESTTGIK